MSRTPPPHLPREQWTSHPRYPAQVLLLGSHDSFRRVSRALVELAEREQQWSEIDRVFRQWTAAMGSHEAYEEHKLYLYLAKRWGIDFAPCELGHISLHGARDGVLRVLSEGKDAEGAWTRLASALRRHDEVLLSHLDIEENLVIPALLALEPHEFERYTRLPPHQLLAELDEQPRAPAPS